MTEGPNKQTRKQLQFQALTGFLGFLAFMSVIQAVINIMQPEPALWPAVLALVLVLATVTVWRIGRQ